LEPIIEIRDLPKVFMARRMKKTAVDPQTRQEIRKLSMKFNHEEKTLILTTHYTEEADKLCIKGCQNELGQTCCS